MYKKYLNLALIFATVSLSLILFGCKHDSIKFYRESSADKLMKSLSVQNEQKKDVLKKSSGMIIYKDNTSSGSNNSNIKFGPRDINFELPTKIK